MFKLLLIVLCSFFISRAFAQSFTWQKIIPAFPDQPLPPPRVHHGMGYFSRIPVIIIFGGNGEGGTLNDTWAFDLSDNTWKELNFTTPEGTPADTPDGRAFMVTGVIDELGWFVIAMGTNSDGEDFNDVWVMDFGVGIAGESNEETSLTTIMPEWHKLNVVGTSPEVRYGGHGGIYPNTGYSFYVGFGFNNKDETGKRLGDMFKIAFDENSTLDDNAFYMWEKVHDGVGLNQYHPFLPHARCLEAYAMTNDEQLVFHGGCLRGGVGGGPCPAEDSWVFNGDEKEWTLLPRCVTPRANGAMSPLPGLLGMGVLYGGDDRFDNGIVEQIISGPRYPENELFVVDADDESWSRKLVLPYSRRLPNGTDVTEDLPQRRYGHSMGGGITTIIVRDSENQLNEQEIRQIVMFGGARLSDSKLFNDVWILTGDPVSSQDLSGDCPAVWFSYLHLHGILLSVAWGMLFPTGVLVARYYRCGQSQKWLVIHVVLQLLALAMSSAGFVIVLLVSGKPNFPHAIIGIILQIFAVQQPINGFLRPHKPDENKTTRNRYCWELWHKSTGYFTVIAGLVNVTLGVFLIIPPLAVWVVWLVALLVWVIVFCIYETIHLLKICECTGQRAAQDTEMVTYPGY